MRNKNNFLKLNQKGAYLVFTILVLGVFFSFAALLIDIGRVSVSSLEQNQITQSAATVAVQAYISPSAAYAGPITTDNQYKARIEYVKNTVSTVLNDSSNQIFALPGEKIIQIDTTGGSNSYLGLTLTAGTYLPDVPNTCNSQECIKCRTDTTPEANKKGCFIESQWETQSTQRFGINAFRAVISTRTASPIKYFFGSLFGQKQSSGISSESYAFQRPRNFISLVDMSASVTGGNFESNKGRQMSKFVYKFQGSGAATGAACIGTDSSTPCSFIRRSNDDFAWNTHLYLNEPTVADGRCDGTDNCTVLNLIGKVCSRDTYSAHAGNNLPTNNSPVFGNDANSPLTGPGNCNGRKTCDSNDWFNACACVNGFPPNNCRHLWRTIGDTRYAAANIPTVIDSQGRYRQPFMRRFKDDYLGVSVSNLPRAKLNADNTGFTSPNVTNETYNGDYLFEDPSKLLADTRYFANNSDDTPRFYDFENPAPSSVNGEGCWDGSIGNGLRGMFAPTVERNYSGPEPYNSILKAFYRIHKGIADQNIPGDRIAIQTFDDLMGSINTNISLTNVIRGEINDVTGLSGDSLKLLNILKAVRPDNNFTSPEKIRSRLQLGFIPDYTKENTNISRAVASAILNLRSSAIQGSDTYLLLFSDFVATGTCSLSIWNDINKNAARSSASATQASIDQWMSECVASSHPTGMTSPDVTDAGERGVRALADFTATNALYDQLKLMNVTPIFFAFNGKDGGNLIFPKPGGSGCLSNQEVSNLGSSIPSAVASAEWAYRYTLNNEREDEYDTQIGILAPAMSTNGRSGKYIRLLPGCSNYGGSMKNRLNAFCDNLEGNDPGQGAIPSKLNPMKPLSNFPTSNGYQGMYGQTGWANQRNVGFYETLLNMGIMHGITWAPHHNSGGFYLFQPNNWGQNGEDVMNWSCGTRRSRLNPNAAITDTNFTIGMGDMIHSKTLSGRGGQYNSFIISDIPKTQVTEYGTIKCNPEKTGMDMSDTIFTEVQNIFMKTSAAIVASPSYYVVAPHKIVDIKIDSNHYIELETQQGEGQAEAG